jgi:hypothetical protein
LEAFMAVNALGQTLLLSLSPQQVSDLTDGLKTGDLLRGRVVETLPDQGQAIVNLRGINVLAELLGQAQSLAKGDILQVQVKGLPAPQAGDTQAPLTLQLLDISKPAEGAPAAPASLAASADPAASSSLASAEESLASLHIAVTRDTLAAARALQALNQPVTPDRIANALKTAAQLLPSEANTATDSSQALLSARSGILAQLAQGQPPLRQMQLQQADKLLLLASSSSAQEVPDSAAPLLRSAALLASAPPQELAPLISTLKQAIQAMESPSEASQAALAPSSPQAGLSPGGLAVLDQALAGLINANPGMSLSSASQALLNQLQLPQSTLAQGLTQQAPQDTISQAQALLSQIAEQKPALLIAQEAIVSPGDVQASLQTQGLLTQTFANQPREQVLNSIVFLQSRQLPATPATIEPVLSTLTSTQELAPQLHGLLEASKNIAEADGNFSTSFKQSISQFEQSFSGLSVDPGADQVAQQLQRSLTLSGMDLESQLAKAPLSSADGAQAQPQAAAHQAQAAMPAVDLKSSLIDLQHQANLELKSPSLLADQRQQVQNVSDQSRQALNQLTTLQLASQPVAGRDTASLQVPVWFGQDLVPGKLSVYWKQGKDASPTDADPVQVVFLLNTRALKDVKVSLSLYSKDCLCRIDVSDPEVRDFLKPNLAQLKEGFSANTPYRLRSLDLGLAQSPAQPSLASLAPEPPTPQGLYLSA